jgi:maltose alpha-D-glucosyltransferase/alpha-amylase
MIHSLHYATMTTLQHHGSSHPDDAALLAPWLEAWYRYVSGSYLKAYLKTMQGSPLIPENRQDLAIMLRSFLIQKAVHELGHALHSRPEEVDLHLRALEMTLREYRCL